MNDINRTTARPSAAHTASRVPKAAQARESQTAEPARAAASASDTDQVELSERARLLSKLQDTPEIRADLVSRTRDEIAQGTYLTPDKLESAADNAIDDLETFG